MEDEEFAAFHLKQRWRVAGVVVKPHVGIALVTGEDDVVFLTDGHLLLIIRDTGAGPCGVVRVVNPNDGSALENFRIYCFEAQ